MYFCKFLITIKIKLKCHYLLCRENYKIICNDFILIIILTFKLLKLQKLKHN